MRRDQIGAKVDWWNLPPEQTKNGLAHQVPLPPMAQDILGSLGFEDCPFWFTTNGKAPISGWSKMMPELRKAAGLDAPWTLHDLRRTFRSGLTALGVEESVGEIMINDRPDLCVHLMTRVAHVNLRRRPAWKRWACPCAGSARRQSRQERRADREPG